MAKGNTQTPRILCAKRSIHSSGEVPEWLKGADCKSAGSGLRWFESTPHHTFSTQTWIAELPAPLCWPSNTARGRATLPVHQAPSIAPHQTWTAELPAPLCLPSNTAGPSTPPLRKPYPLHPFLLQAPRLPHETLSPRHGFNLLPLCYHPCRHTVVAQLVEQRIPNPQVGGSIPSDRATTIGRDAERFGPDATFASCPQSSFRWMSSPRHERTNRFNYHH